MDRQKLLDSFISTTAGDGQCVDTEGMCQYVHDHLPGCAIGCQPGFREKFGEEEWVTDNLGIVGILNGEDGIETQAAVEEFFGVVHRVDDDNASVDDRSDVHFLGKLQELHDASGWEDGQIYHPSLVCFCEYWDLKIPQVSS